MCENLINSIQVFNSNTIDQTSSSITSTPLSTPTSTSTSSSSSSSSSSASTSSSISASTSLHSSPTLSNSNSFTFTQQVNSTTRNLKKTKHKKSILNNNLDELNEPYFKKSKNLDTSSVCSNNSNKSSSSSNSTSCRSSCNGSGYIGTDCASLNIDGHNLIYDLWAKSNKLKSDYNERSRQLIFVQDINCLELAKEKDLNKKELVDLIQVVVDGEKEETEAFSLTADNTAELSSTRTSPPLQPPAATQVKKKRNKLKSFKLKYEINICRDCFNEDSSVDSNNQMCRFIGWRKLQKPKPEIDQLNEIGFLELADATEQDNLLWSTKSSNQLSKSTRMNNNNNNAQLELENHLKIFSFVGKHFCDLIEKEIRFRQMFPKRQTWKRQIIETRELCDQCKTSIFNGHMVCPKCGFSVCINCYEFRLKKLQLNEKKLIKHRDNYNWHFCSRYEINNFELRERREFKKHTPENLIFCQYIPPHIVQTIYDEFKQISCFYELPIYSTNLYENTDMSNWPNHGWYGKKLGDHFLVLNGNWSSSDNTKSKSEFDSFLFEKFDNEWHNKRPVLIKNLHKNLNQELWTPESFSTQFGDLTIDLINCRNQRVVSGVQMKEFWLGFENPNERLCDLNSRPLILKLKDWPTSDDFKKVLPTRFDDLMNNMPISNYTHRDGSLNLVASLPDFFLKPDLGPKLYIAYSSVETPKEGTTNLHVDISDAVNLMMYVGCCNNNNTNTNPIGHEHSEIFKSRRKSSNEKDVLYKALKDSLCDKLQLNRYLNGEKPGALWHIFRPQDADKIRTFLLMFNIEKGRSISNDNDPIHDQTNYLDNNMLAKLKEEYEVEVFTIVQYLGDAIFIPAGAPHQVRNLNSCIKVAGDFVTPQGVDQCLNITEQLRQLSEKHSNHEDKLQVKNIIYHRIKQSVSFLKSLIVEK